MDTKPTPRHFDLDWLRVLAILMVFVFHSSRFFDTGGWHVKNAETYFGVQVWTTFLANWLMPAIFMVSGASLFFALSGSNGKFIKDKVLRLLVPLLVGVFTFSVTQVYVERVNHGQFQGTLLEFLPHYFEGLYGFGGNFAFHGIHLWYLLVLFIFTFLLMPLFWWFKDATGERVLHRLGDLLALPGAIALFVAPTLVLRFITDSGALGGGYALGGWRPVQYLWFLLAGYLIVSHERLQQRIIQARWICLMLAVLLVTLSLAQDMGPDGYRILAVWPGLLAMLGFAMKHLTYSNRFLAYSNEAVLPFYILHQNVLLWVGFFLNSEAAGYYKAAFMVVTLLAVTADPLIATTYPEINRLIVQRAWPRLKDFLRKVTTLSLAYNLLQALFFIIFGQWILWIYGRQYVPAYPALVVLLAGVAFNYTLFWNRPLLLALGLPDFPIWVTLAVGLAKVGLAFILVPRFGYVAEAALLSFYYIASVGIMAWHGVSQVRRRSAAALP